MSKVGRGKEASFLLIAIKSEHPAFMKVPRVLGTY